MKVSDLCGANFVTATFGFRSRGLTIPLKCLVREETYGGKDKQIFHYYVFTLWTLYKGSLMIKKSYIS
jgi:hypothetical protein